MIDHEKEIMSTDKFMAPYYVVGAGWILFLSFSLLIILIK